MQMWFCGLIMEAQNLSWVSVSPAAQQKSIPPPTVIAVMPNMHRQLAYFLFYSPLSHKVQFNKRMGGTFFHFSLITHDGGM